MERNLYRVTFVEGNKRIMSFIVQIKGTSVFDALALIHKKSKSVAPEIQEVVAREKVQIHVAILDAHLFVEDEEVE